MLFSWRAALCAAPTILVLAGSAWLAKRANTKAERDDEASSGVIVAWPSTADDSRLHRVALKQETVADVLDGRLSFEAAVERFWEVTTTAPDAMAQLRESGAGATDEQRVLNQFVAFCRIAAARDPARYAAILARIEQEASSTQVLGRSAH